MQRHLSAMVLAGLAVAGCAGPSSLTRTGDVIRAAASQAGDLGGTWKGSFGWPGGSYWPDDGNCTLRIKDDGTFTAHVVPIPGANNLPSHRAGPGRSVVTETWWYFASRRGRP